MKAVTEHNYKSNLVNYNMTNSNSASYKKRFDYQLRMRTMGMLARNVKVWMVGATDVVAQVSHSKDTLLYDGLLIYQHNTLSTVFSDACVFAPYKTLKTCITANSRTLWR